MPAKKKKSAPRPPRSAARKKPAAPDRWVKCISTDGNLRGVAIQGTHLLREIIEKHGYAGAPAQGLGEAVLGALMIASYCKSGERINLNIRGSGKIRQALVDAHPDGSARGYVIPSETSRGPGFWGEGLLSVLRAKAQPGEKPYIGTVPLLTGHLAKDLTFYWVQSEQIPSAVGLAVNLDSKGKISSAGGFLVQALPGATTAEISQIERHIHEIQSLAASLADDADPLQLLSKIFQSTAFVVLEEKSLRFECRCSQERVEKAIALLGVDELESMIEEKEAVEVRCDFCSQTFQVSKGKLKKFVANLKK